VEAVGCRRSAAQGAVTGAQKARFHIPLAKGANHEISNLGGNGCRNRNNIFVGIFDLRRAARFVHAGQSNSVSGLNKNPPDFVPLALANLVLAFLLAFIFEHWANVRTFVGGLKSGAIIMFLIALSKDLSFMGYMNLFKGFTPVLVDVFAETVRVSLAGGAIEAVLGMMSKDAETAGL
jgi:hypothetical protein